MDISRADVKRLVREMRDQHGVPATTTKRWLRHGYCPLPPRIDGLRYSHFDRKWGLVEGFTSHVMKQGYCSIRWSEAGGAHPLRSTWSNMIQRCHNPKFKQYYDYGGRGIHVCGRWRMSFDAFLADVGDKPSAEHTIDRIDNARGYEPGNVRWATWTEQHANKRVVPPGELGKGVIGKGELGEPYIVYDPRRARYRVKLGRKSKDFVDLAEAIKWRDENMTGVQWERTRRSAS